MSRNSILAEVWYEREEQDKTWGEQNHPDLSPDYINALCRTEYRHRATRWRAENTRLAKIDKTGWDGVLLEEVYEALAEEDPAKLRAELVQVAAVAAAWIEAIDRRSR